MGKLTNRRDWVNRAGVGGACGSDHTGDDFAFGLQLRHGLFKCGNIHLCLVIDWHSDHRLKTHAHHCHVFLHAKMRVF